MRLTWGTRGRPFLRRVGAFPAGLLAALLCAAVAADAVVPADALLERLKPDGFVNDFAGVVPAQQREALEQRVRLLQQKTGAELALVTVPSLEGGEIDDFTQKLFHRWGVGQKGRNNGAMLLVAIGDRRMRIEVGYGLEPILPDALAGRIINEDLRPLFRENRYADGLGRAVERIAGIVERGEAPSAADAGTWPFRPSDAPLPVQVIATAMLSVFMVLAAAFLGVGLGSRTILATVAGLFFGGIVAFMALMIGGFVPVALGGIGLVALGLGVRDGLKHPGKYRGRSSRGGWIAGGDSGSDGGWGGGGFSGSDSGGFGGGDSGGGGASGSW